MSRTTETFQQAAQNKNPAVFDFKREVKQTWRDFPEIKDTVLFFNANSGAKLVYPEKGARKQKKRARRLARKVAHLRRDNILSKIGYRLTGLPGERGSYTLTRLSDGLRFVSHVTIKSTHDHIAATASAAQEATFVFDHELGHALTPMKIFQSANPNLGECIGDAYATIRHFQRYGAGSPAIDAIVANRAFDLIFRNAGYGRDHFTSPVTEKILACRYDIDWGSLTPAQTLQKALRFALENRMEAATLETLDKDFSALHGKVESIIKKHDTTPFQALAEKVLSTDSPNVFKYGSMALELSIDQRALKGEYWNNVRQKLAGKQKTFTQQKPQRATTHKSVNLNP